MQTDTALPSILPPTGNPLAAEPIAASPQAAAPPPVKKPVLTKKMILIAAVGVIIVVALFGSMFLVGQQSTNVPTAPTPTPVATQSADSTRPLSSIATESAFLEFEKASDDLVRGIQNAQIVNQAILPPTLDLPLGFSL